ncbi:tripeptide aminopeptidase PepT [Treponema pectinovorum]|uniref:tripeptide aminopeptidase PepT n=1 Tax=Treponema pectinovorum TaxID=164 RepID=UPI003D8E611C
MILLTEKEKTSLLERFIKYVKVWTTSDSQQADIGIQPSTQNQFNLAHILERELKNLGLEDVQVTDKCYVYARLPASKGKEHIAPYCLLSHMDTSEECSGQDVNPQLTKRGNDTIITSDGTTLLGADDKAGIAEIMEMLSYLQAHNDLVHSTIEICFSPDEETGHGMDNVPLHLIKSKHAYTVDGGNLGELETECFNAFKSKISFTGIATHTGTARSKMVNAITMASSFVVNLPKNQAPETTCKMEGFYAPMEIKGSIENAEVTVFLRDFSTKGMQERKNFIDLLAKTTAKSFGGKVQVEHTQQYLNMKEGLKKSPETVKNLINAYKASGIEPVFTPIRGGTDGSRLTEMGIPTPNIFTGGHNFHSKTEWASLNEMCKALEVLINLSIQN